MSSIESAKDACDILQVELEGITVLRKSRIELLISKFENLQMEENETIGQYHARIRDISNVSFILGEKIYEKKLIQKVLRTLLERFA